MAIILIYWWLPLVLSVALMVAFIVARKKQKKPSQKHSLPVAHMQRLIRLPEYGATMGRLRLFTRIGLAFSTIALLSGLVLAGRYATITVIEPETKSRDIMLCLDVSGSMVSVDKEIVKKFSELAKGFDGERLGLTVFDGMAATVFPLTNDYSYISEKLKEAEQSFDRYDYDLVAGTYGENGSSIIGDGLASCVSRFDRLDSKRSRSVILATDNYLAGNPIVTLAEAAAFAKSKQVRVYGINPADYSSSYYVDKTAKEFHDQVLSTGGDYYKLDDRSSVDSIISKIGEQEATRFKGSPQIVTTDQPAVFIILALVSSSFLIFTAWRFRL